MDIERFQILIKRMNGLLDDKQEGLYSWSLMFEACIKELREQIETFYS